MCGERHDEGAEDEPSLKGGSDREPVSLTVSQRNPWLPIHRGKVLFSGQRDARVEAGAFSSVESELTRRVVCRARTSSHRRRRRRHRHRHRQTPCCCCCCCCCCWFARVGPHKGSSHERGHSRFRIRDKWISRVSRRGRSRSLCMSVCLCVRVCECACVRGVRAELEILVADRDGCQLRNTAVSSW